LSLQADKSSNRLTPRYHHLNFGQIAARFYVPNHMFPKIFVIASIPKHFQLLLNTILFFFSSKQHHHHQHADDDDKHKRKKEKKTLNKTKK